MRIAILVIMLIMTSNCVCYSQTGDGLFNMGQSVDSQVKQHLKELKKAKVDTVSLYHMPCSGSEPTFVEGEECKVYDTRYLYWIKNGKTFLRKLDNCNQYQPLELKQSAYLSNFIDNRKAIEKELIQLIKIVQTRDNGTKDTILTTRDHTCFYEMELLLGKTRVMKSVASFDLENPIYEGEVNLNHEYNQQTKTKLLTDLVQKEIAMLEGERLFKRRE
jgi:hypothetical protein